MFELWIPFDVLGVNVIYWTNQPLRSACYITCLAIFFHSSVSLYNFLLTCLAILFHGSVSSLISSAAVAFDNFTIFLILNLLRKHLLRLSWLDYLISALLAPAPWPDLLFPRLEDLFARFVSSLAKPLASMLRIRAPTSLALNLIVWKSLNCFLFGRAKCECNLVNPPTTPVSKCMMHALVNSGWCHLTGDASCWSRS